jgi:hypothetical protein
LRKTSLLECSLLIGGGLVMVYPNGTADALGLACCAIAFSLQYMRSKPSVDISDADLRARIGIVAHNSPPNDKQLGR